MSVSRAKSAIDLSDFDAWPGAGQRGGGVTQAAAAAAAPAAEALPAGAAQPALAAPEPAPAPAPATPAAARAPPPAPPRTVNPYAVPPPPAGGGAGARNAAALNVRGRLGLHSVYISLCTRERSAACALAMGCVCGARRRRRLRPHESGAGSLQKKKSRQWYCPTLTVAGSARRRRGSGRVHRAQIRRPGAARGKRPGRVNRARRGARALAAGAAAGAAGAQPTVRWAHIQSLGALGRSRDPAQTVGGWSGRQAGRTTPGASHASAYAALSTEASAAAQRM